MKELKIGFRFMQYGLKPIGSIVLSVIIFVGGCFLEALEVNIMNTGTLFILLGAVMPIQILFSVDASEMVQSSRFKRRLQIQIPTKILMLTYTVSYFVILGIRLVKLYMHPEMAETLGGEMIMSGFAFILISFYFGVAFKRFALSIVLFTVSYTIMVGYSIVSMIFEFIPRISFLFSSVFCFIAMLIGIAVFYGFVRGLYRMQFSKYAFGSALK